MLDIKTAHCAQESHGMSYPQNTKTLVYIFSLVVTGLWSEVYSTNAQVNVTQFHNHDSRDGLYVDSAFTPDAAANLARDLNFDGTISGLVYAQPLYIDNGPGGRPTIIAVTESNNVYALDAVDGSVIWHRNVGDPVFQDDLTCRGAIDQYGITGTPIVDLASRALFFNAMITPDGGITKKHLVFSLNTDTGDINPGWPVDVGEVAMFNGMTFTPSQQAQRPALGIVDNILYVPYGGLFDCRPYHGWLVGVPINNPAGAMAWATGAIGGGVWGVGGVASDGTNPFITTGNTFNTGGNWMGGEAVIRFQPGPIFTGSPDDYWAPLNWLILDNNDKDLGSSGPLLVDVPGATPSALVVASGKDGNAYLLDRNYFGGISDPVASSHVFNGFITQAAATYRTNQGTYVAFRASGGMLSACRITATNPPAIVTGWSVSRNGCGSPFVTSTDGTNNTIVWVVGTQGDQQLHGYDGDTGAVVYAGGGANELMAGTHSYPTTGIAARGRIYVATDNKVYAFIVPGVTSTPGSFAAVILATEPANLKGYWKCDETSGTTLVDSSGNSKNLTLHGVAGSAYSLAQSGEQGGSIRFYGTTNSYADRSDSPKSILGSSNLQNSNWTMFALVKGDAQAAGAASVMGLGNSATAAPFVDMDSGHSLTKIRAHIRNNDFSYTVNFEGGTAFDSIWHSVVFRRNGTNFDTFVDGVITGAFSGTPTITNPIVVTSLGKLIKSGNQFPSLNGYIQHAAIWNRALSDSEIMAIQTARFAAVILATEPANLKGYWKCDETSGTTLVDSSGNSKNLTLHGVAGSAYSLAQSGEQGGSIRFYGTTNSYADRSDSPKSILGSSNLQNSNWTMFALVKGDAQAAGAASVMGLGNSATAAPFVDMDSGPSLTKIRAHIRNNDFSYTVNFEGGTAFDSIWHSVVFRRNGTNFDTFVDGVITGAFSGTPTITNPIVVTSLGKLIKSGNQFPSLNGYIQHAAIWNRALSDSEIMAIQTARTINPTPTP